MTPLDLTQPLALRGSPTVQVPGPFLRNEPNGNIAAFLDNTLRMWNPAGGRWFGLDPRLDDLDLVPLQTAPRKWLRVWANEYASVYSANISEERANEIAMSNAIRTVIPMIELAACDGLAEALTRYANTTSGIGHGIARAALADWEARK